MDYEYDFLCALVTTIVIETLVLWGIIRGIYKIDTKKISNALILFLGIFCSLSTLPYLWFILPFFIHKYLYLNIFGESIVVILEAIIYFFVLKLGFKKSISISLLCNIASYVVGRIVM